MIAILKWGRKILSFVLSIGLFGMLVAFFFMEINGHINGYQLKSVQSGSMAPEFETGSIIVVQQIDDPSVLQKGDIISFENKKEQLITHRIHHVVQEGMLFQTKGDHNQAPDHGVVEAQQIVAQYTGLTLPYLGYISTYLQSKLNIPLFLILCGGLFVLYSLTMFWQIYRHLDKKPSEQQTTL